MDVIDCHSYYTQDHPLHAPPEPSKRGSNHRYLVAPPAESLDLAAFRARLEGATTVAGGLLPLHGLDETTFARALDDRWWSAILLTPVYTEGARLDAPEVYTRLALPAACSRPVMIECGVEGYSRPPALAAFLAASPPRPVILTHGGQLNISGSHLSAAGELFERYPHTFLETSGIYRQDFLEEMLTRLGPERILYGSGHPWMHEWLEQERVWILPASRTALEAMMGGNARRLFGLAERTRALPLPGGAGVE